MKICPFCAEEIQDKAIKCRYCGSTIDMSLNLGASVPANVAASGGSKQAKNGSVEGRHDARTKPQRVKRWSDAKVTTMALVMAVVFLAAVVGFSYLSFIWSNTQPIAHPNPAYRDRPDLQASVTQSQQAVTADAARKKRLEEHFSAWDGAHIGLTRAIKDTMNDPSSYDHVETNYIDNGNHFIVTTRFRGANAFGGLVLSTVRARVDLDGNVVEILP